MWFVCPHARCRARVLYLPPGGRQFASRRAWRLTYRSRRESGAHRRLAGLFSRMEALPPGASRWDDPGYVRLAFAALDEEAREERQWKARERRNAVRRIRRGEKANRGGDPG